MPSPPSRVGAFFEIFLIALRLGCTSFGGPVAHLGYFRNEYVVKRKWIDEETFTDVTALAQMLPGPVSSQVGMAIGVRRGGLAGGLAFWFGFTLPSAIAMILFAYGVASLSNAADADWLHGLEIAAVAIVALAVWGMAKTICIDAQRVGIAIGAALAALLFQSHGALVQVAIIIGGGIIGWQLYRKRPGAPSGGRGFGVSPLFGAACLLLFALLLIFLPIAASLADSRKLSLR